MLIGKQFGRYEIRSKIGAGGMGEVYVGFDTELNRKVAIKILPKEFSDDETRKNRFRQEARAVSALNHPNIITIYEIGENEHGSFIVTEMIDGSTLRGIIKHEPLTMIRTLKIIEQVANALVAAHQAHIIHRDIKPENIMVRLDSIVKVLDFGLAKPILQEADEDEDEVIKTIPGVVMGSARYMSPEQTRGIRVDERADIWSLGVVLYEMITGNAPFKGATTSDTIAAVIYKEPEPILNLVHHAPAELQRIVRKALQKDRDERYQNVKDFALDVKNLIYELEHENSGERSHSIPPNLDITENPTMIHQTVSANHPTRDTAFTTSGIQNSIERAKKSPWKFALASLGLIAVLTAFGFGFYRWLGGKTNVRAAAFTKTQVSGINTDGKVNAPVISPDGKYIAYAGGETGSRSLVVRQVTTDSVVTIVPPTAQGLFGISFSPDGDYVYYLLSNESGVVNTLYRIPTLGGTPKKLIEDVDSAVTFSPDGKQLAFQRNVSKDAIVIIYTANIDGTNVQPLIRSNETEFNVLGTPQWSPDGKTILVQAYNNFGGTVEKVEIGEINLAEKKLKIFGTRQWYSVFNFCWFKDASGFLFIGQEAQGAPAQIWRADYPNGEFHPVTNDINNYNSLGLSADGKTIVTLKSNSTSSLWSINPANKQQKQITAESQTREGSNGLVQMPNGDLVHTRRNGSEINLWVMNEDTTNARQLTTEVKSIFMNPAISPDGRYIVFSSKQAGMARIWRMDADGKNIIQLTKDKPNTGDFNPQITPDGKTVVYNEYASGNNGASSFMKVSIDGGESSVVYQNDQFNVNTQVISPDGKYIAYNSYQQSNFDRKLRVASFEGNSFGQIAKEFSTELINSFVWSPDSKSLTFLSSRGGVQNLWRLPLDGSAPQPLTEFKSGRIFNYAWSADGKNLLIVRGTVTNDLILIRDSASNSNQ
jgi:eukaryotic-like serine/threonine-protein kinase